MRKIINTKLHQTKLKIILAGLMLLVFGSVLCMFYFEGVFDFIGVPVGYKTFNDARVITAGAESYYQGFDPLVENPAMPTKNVMNYPRIWHSLFYFGLNQDHTMVFGGLAVLLYLLGIFITMSACSRYLGVLIVSVCALSPASALGMERGNIDLIVYFLVVLVAFWAGRAVVLSAATLLLAIALKIFPIFAAPVLLIKPKSKYNIWILAGVVLISASYFIASYRDLVLIGQGTPRAYDLSYGKNVIFYNESRALWAWLAVGFSAYASFLISRKYLVVSNDKLQSADGLSFFVVGALIYMGTFLIGNNWDYRLIFLILTVPFAVSFSYEFSDKRSLLVVKGYIAAVVLSLWYLFFKKYLGYAPPFQRVVWVIDEASNWIVFVLQGAFLLKIAGASFLWPQIVGGKR